MSDDWFLYDIAHLSRGEYADSVEFEGHTGDMLGEQTSGQYAVFAKDNRIMLVDIDEVDP